MCVISQSNVAATERLIAELGNLDGILSPPGMTECFVPLHGQMTHVICASLFSSEK